MAIFTPGYRDQLRCELVEMARKDGRISGGAITGSASVRSPRPDLPPAVRRRSRRTPAATPEGR
jgi:hypothetical protein